MAPYHADLSEFVVQFATSDERKAILHGLLAYRAELRAIGIPYGFQWFDGSFVEDCENTRGRAPGDLDLITFAPRPTAYADAMDWQKFIHSRPDLFDPEVTKKTFKCDAYFVDLSIHPMQLVAHTRFWFGLFSHQRDSYLWKGMVQVPLFADDADAELLLTENDNAS